MTDRKVEITREEVLAVLRAIAEDKENPAEDRLKALELLARALGMFPGEDEDEGGTP